MQRHSREHVCRQRVRAVVRAKRRVLVLWGHGRTQYRFGHPIDEAAWVERLIRRGRRRCHCTQCVSGRGVRVGDLRQADAHRVQLADA